MLFKSTIALVLKLLVTKSFSYLKESLDDDLEAPAEWDGHVSPDAGVYQSRVQTVGSHSCDRHNHALTYLPSLETKLDCIIQLLYYPQHKHHVLNHRSVDMSQRVETVFRLRPPPLFLP